jgi:uncharacterized repeat protein (TIGR04138 family)
MNYLTDYFLFSSKFFFLDSRYVIIRFMSTDINEYFVKIVHADSRYALDAYEFVLEGLSFTQKCFRRTSHVSGQELVEGVKSLAVRKFGSLAFYVLQTWGIQTPLDIGRIVFIMIEHGLLSRRDEDTLQDFMLDFDLQKECQRAYQLQVKRVVRRLH